MVDAANARTSKQASGTPKPNLTFIRGKSSKVTDRKKICSVEGGVGDDGGGDDDGSEE